MNLQHWFRISIIKAEDGFEFLMAGIESVRIARSLLVMFCLFLAPLMEVGLAENIPLSTGNLYKYCLGLFTSDHPTVLPDFFKSVSFICQFHEKYFYLEWICWCVINIFLKKGIKFDHPGSGMSVIVWIDFNFNSSLESIENSRFLASTVKGSGALLRLSILIK